MADFYVVTLELESDRVSCMHAKYLVSADGSETTLSAHQVQWTSWVG